MEDLKQIEALIEKYYNGKQAWRRNANYSGFSRPRQFLNGLSLKQRCFAITTSGKAMNLQET